MDSVCGVISSDAQRESESFLVVSMYTMVLHKACMIVNDSVPLERVATVPCLHKRWSVRRPARTETSVAGNSAYAEYGEYWDSGVGRRGWGETRHTAGTAGRAKEAADARLSHQ